MCGQRLPLFKDLSEYNLQVIAAMLHFVPMRPGETLFKEGDTADAREGRSWSRRQPGPSQRPHPAVQATVCSLSTRATSALSHTVRCTRSWRAWCSVVNGRCAARADDTGAERVLNTFKRGQFFGEIGLIADMPRTATIVATDKCLLLGACVLAVRRTVCEYPPGAELTKKDFKTFLKMSRQSSVASNISELMKKRTAEHFRKYKVRQTAAWLGDSAQHGARRRRCLSSALFRTKSTRCWPRRATLRSSRRSVRGRDSLCLSHRRLTRADALGRTR